MKIRIIVVISVLVALVSCGKSKRLHQYASPPNTENTKYNLYDLYEDENGQRGIVVYNDVDPSTNEGVVFVLSLDESKERWGPQNVEVYPITSQDDNVLIWTPGYTLGINQMVNSLGRELYPAFAWCHNKNPEGEAIHGSSWILPGLWEWDDAMLKQIDWETLNAAIVSFGGTPLRGSGEYYWTASEDQEGAVVFKDGDPEYEPNWDYNPRERAVHMSIEGNCLIDKVYWSKSLQYFVRAVKYIYCYEPYSPKE